MLYLVVGPSGVGKDTILDELKKRLTAEQAYFPQRHITRPATSGGEDHVAETDESFDALEKKGAFCLSWRAHDLNYGVPVDIVDALRKSIPVFVNVSRTVIDEAKKLTPDVCVLELNASPEIIRQRLHQRGRESTDQIEERVKRAVAFDVPSGVKHMRVLNDGPLEETVQHIQSKIGLQ